jgi:hypothetical protein
MAVGTKRKQPGRRLHKRHLADLNEMINRVAVISKYLLAPFCNEKKTSGHIIHDTMGRAFKFCCSTTDMNSA